MSFFIAQKSNLNSSKIIKLVLIFLFLNGICDGSLITTLAVYISDVKGMGFKGVSVFYTSFGISSVVISLLTTSSIGNISIEKRAYWGTSLLAIGYPVILLIRTSEHIAFPGILCGAGMSLYVSALISCLNNLSTDLTRRSVFSQRNLYVSAGQCSGSILVGGLTYFLGNSVASYFLVYKLFCMLFFGAICWFLFNWTTGQQQKNQPHIHEDQSNKKSNILMIFFALTFNFLATMIVVGQIDTVLPLIATQLMRVDLSKFSMIIVANTLTVVFFQSHISKLTSRISEGKVITLSAVFWLISYIWCLTGVTILPNEPTMILVVFSIINGVGQCLFSSAYYPYISIASSPGDFKRFSSGSSAAFNCGKALGLSYSGFALETKNVYFVWLYLAISSLAMLIFTVAIQLHIRKLANPIMNSEKPNVIPNT